MQDAGTRNAIFLLRNVCEKMIEVKKDLYFCFIDYTKAFDEVKHSELVKKLAGLEVDGKDLRIVRNLYWEQSAAGGIEGKLASFCEIKRQVRQGCIL